MNGTKIKEQISPENDTIIDIEEVNPVSRFMCFESMDKDRTDTIIPAPKYKSSMLSTEKIEKIKGTNPTT